MGTEDEFQPVDSDTGNDAGFDYSSFGVEEAAPVTEASPIENGDNPKWAAFLAEIPAPFHPKAKEFLAARDREIQEATQQRAQEWAPYKTFRDRGVTPQELQDRYDLVTRLQTDSVGFYGDLQQALIQRGLLQNESQVPQQEEAVNLDPDDPYAQKIAELQARLDERDGAYASYFQEQQQAEVMQRMVSEENQRIDQSFSSIESKTGPLSGPLKAQIIEKAIFMGNSQGRPVAVEEAAAEVFKFMQQATAARSRAPRTLPTGGSIPQTQSVDPGEMTKGQRFDAAKAIRDRIYGSQND